MPSGRKRSKRPYGQGHRELLAGRLSSMPRSELGPRGQEYSVQYVSGSDKTYVCPACLRPVPAGQAHVVAWPLAGPWGSEMGVDSRRHWHQYCWQRRLEPI